MKILHVLDHSLPLHSGYAFRTLAILREQHARGWETCQLTAPRHNAGDVLSEEVDGWRFHRTPLPLDARRRGFGYVQEMMATHRRLETLIEEFRPDVLHAHSPVLNALPALRAGRRHRLPVVYEIRAFWEDAAVDIGTASEGGLRYRLSRALETYAVRRADHVTTICEGLRDDIVARGCPAERVTVIPNGVDPRAFAFDTEPDAGLRTRLGLDGTTVVGFVGSFYAYEGLDLLIEALAWLAPRNPDLRVLLVGGGPQEAALKALAEARGLSRRVVLVGRVPHEQVQRYYGLVDVLAYPRRRMRLTELVTPLKPLEAMAQGRMFVASDVGGHRELVRDGETGFLFEAGSANALATALERVLTQRADWPRVQAQARRFVEAERTWAESVARYAPVYGGLTIACQATAELRADRVR